MSAFTLGCASAEPVAEDDVCRLDRDRVAEDQVEGEEELHDDHGYVGRGQHVRRIRFNEALAPSQIA